jgi:ethanolamine utilization protein EutA
VSFMYTTSRNREEVISVGIDIGTSTTKVVISRFTLLNVAGTSYVPRIEISDREILYRSPIHPTPLQTSTLIDQKGIMNIINNEYAKGGIRPQDVMTGAVIITGETATKENAKQIVHLLSLEAGEFLVATAGPDLEAMIAAKGSGAYDHSIKTGKCIANVDIGGGTANIAVYKSGRLLGTCTLHLGGRLIQFNGNVISSISAPVKKLIDQLGCSLTTGDFKYSISINKVVDKMVDTLGNILSGKAEETDAILIVGKGITPNWGKTIDEIMFSGGVGECIYQLKKDHSRESELTPIDYQDIGMLIASTLMNSPKFKIWQWRLPTETVRATVIGAGTQSTEISGSTIQVTSTKLPIRSLPLYQISFKGFSFKRSSFSKYSFKAESTSRKNEVTNILVESMVKAIQLYDPQSEGVNFALYLTDIPVLTFAQVQMLAEGILHAFQLKVNQSEPMVVVLSKDMAKVLGQSIQALNTTHRDIICIDEISVEHGDYVDIGVLLRSNVVPVVVKTLAFQS